MMNERPAKFAGRFSISLQNGIGPPGIKDIPGKRRPVNDKIIIYFQSLPGSGIYLLEQVIRVIQADKILARMPEVLFLGYPVIHSYLFITLQVPAEAADTPAVNKHAGNQQKTFQQYRRGQRGQQAGAGKRFIRHCPETKRKRAPHHQQRQENTGRHKKPQPLITDEAQLLPFRFAERHHGAGMFIGIQHVLNSLYGKCR